MSKTYVVIHENGECWGDHLEGVVGVYKSVRSAIKPRELGSDVSHLHLFRRIEIWNGNECLGELDKNGKKL